jgi:hypothetical protein
MAYNYRPKTTEEILDLGISPNKSEVIILLFKSMRSSFKSHDEYITIDTSESKLGDTKILRMFEKHIDLNEYKKKFKGINLSFGDGSNASSKSPSTQQQELITLTIFEELLSSKTKNYTKFGELLPKLLKIYPSIKEEKSWYKSFELQFTDILKKTKLPKNKFDVYNRDGGFMDFISKLVNSKFEIAKKDSWNPADIWLLDSSNRNKIKDSLYNAVSIEEVNDLLKESFKSKDIVGISLKKNDGKSLNYDLVNLKSNDKPSQVDFITFNLNIPFDGKQFTAVTSNLSISYNGSDYSMGVKSNQSGIGNITYEFLGKGAAAFLGKVPKDMLKLELKRYNFKMPEHTHFMKFNRADFEKKAKKITSKKSWFTINGSLDNFVDNLELSWSNGRSKDNVIISQIFTFAYIIASLSKKELNDLSKKLFYMSQKKGKIFGPFGKLY